VPVWAWVLVNQLAFPGLGTLATGRRIGYAQAALMLAGFLLTMGFLGWYLLCCLRYVRHPAWEESDFVALYRPYHWAWQWGLVLCAVAWLWSLASSIGMLREAKRLCG
jgi:hypothetical protein